MTLVVLEAGQEALIVVVVPAVPLPDTRAEQVASVHDVVETNIQETLRCGRVRHTRGSKMWSRQKHKRRYDVVETNVQEAVRCGRDKNTRDSTMW